MDDDKPYEFQEYPKWIYSQDAAPVLVQSAEEEAALKPKRTRKPKEPEAE